MNELALIPGTKVTRIGLQISRRISFDEWAQVGHVLTFLEGSLQWAIGDWVNYGDANFGEEYAQEIDARSAHTRQQYAWVCASVGFSRRREDLTFSHHVEVATLDPEDQSEWLERAAMEGWTVRDLREHLRVSKVPKLPEAEFPAGQYRVLYACKVIETDALPF